MHRALPAAALLVLLSAPARSGEAAAVRERSSCPPPPRLVGVQRLPSGTKVDGDAFGGISGIDFDAVRNRWWLLSDDRGEHGPARFFEAELRIGRRGLTQPLLRASRHLSAPASTPAGPGAHDGRELVDGEALRVLPDGTLLVASEGDPALGIGQWLRRHRIDGSAAGDLPLPPALRMSPASPEASATSVGPRANRAVEGLAVGADGAGLWIALEAPLWQDGPTADASGGANLRFTYLPHAIEAQADVADRLRDMRQFVYRAEPAQAHGADEYSDNGVSEILAFDAGTLLVLERGGHRQRDGTFRFRSRLYCAELAGATDVAALGSLRDSSWRPVRKRLLLDFGSLPDGAANFEAMAWAQASGSRRRLVVASDDNFFAGVPTVLIALEFRRAPR